MSTYPPPERIERSLLADSVTNGNSYRVSKRQQLDDGQQFTVDIDPNSEAVYIETPSIEAEAFAHVDVWENASVVDGGTTTEDIIVHNQRYDQQDQPSATIQRIANGDTDTSTADKTEETLVQGGGVFGGAGANNRRGFWRIVPSDMRITIIVTDQSDGSGNNFAFDTVIHEGLGLI